MLCENSLKILTALNILSCKCKHGPLCRNDHLLGASWSDFLC